LLDSQSEDLRARPALGYIVGQEIQVSVNLTVTVINTILLYYLDETLGTAASNNQSIVPALDDG
jgi:hypothetical protein